MQNSSLVGGFTTEYVTGASSWVSANNGEIVRQASVLLRLIETMDSGGSSDAYGELVGRVAGRLSNCLGIFELYRRNDEAELAASCSELEKAICDREMLRVRKQVGDISEEEYGLKMAVAEWSVGRFGARKRELEGGVVAMGGLMDQFGSDFVEEVGRLAAGDYRKIRDLGLDPKLADAVIGSLGRLAEKIG